jgi:hypothetical protein
MLIIAVNTYIFFSLFAACHDVFKNKNLEIHHGEVGHGFCLYLFLSGLFVEYKKGLYLDY